MAPVSDDWKVVVILNSLSSKKKFFYRKILPSISAVLSTEVVETQSSDDAISLASKAVESGASAIFAAGGDGTLHQVVNGVLKGREGNTVLPAIGLLPIGSANDFARTLNLGLDPEKIKRLLVEFNPKPVDVGKATFLNGENSQPHYFINISDTGMGPDVAEYMNGGNKIFGSAIAYYSGILKTFLTYVPKEVQVKTEEWSWSGKIRSLAIANGKYFGHGLCIAPEAKIEDGIFSVFIVEDISVFDFIRYSETLKKGKMVIHPKVHYRHATKIEISSSEQLMMEADGELMGQLPVRVEVLPKRLSFLY